MFFLFICLFYLHVKKRNVKATFSIDFQERRHASSVAAPTNAGLNDSSSATRPLPRPCSNFLVTSSNAFWSRCGRFAMARQQATKKRTMRFASYTRLEPKNVCYPNMLLLFMHYAWKLLFMHYAWKLFMQNPHTLDDGWLRIS